MRRLSFGVVAALLMIDFFLIFHVVTHAKDTGAVDHAAQAAGAGVLLALALVGLSGTLRGAVCTAVTLMGLDAVAFLYLFFSPWRPAESEAGEWATLPPAIATMVLGVALTVLIVILLVALRLRRRNN